MLHQGSAVLNVGKDVVYLGNQWNTGLRETPPGPRNNDLLYWGVFDFEPPSPVACEVSSPSTHAPTSEVCSTKHVQNERNVVDCAALLCFMVLWCDNDTYRRWKFKSTRAAKMSLSLAQPRVQ